jgi:hypothetical protein
VLLRHCPVNIRTSDDRSIHFLTAVKLRVNTSAVSCKITSSDSAKLEKMGLPRTLLYSAIPLTPLPSIPRLQLHLECEGDTSCFLHHKNLRRSTRAVTSRVLQGPNHPTAARSSDTALEKLTVSCPLKAVDMKQTPFARTCLNLKPRAAIMIVKLTLGVPEY